MDTLNVVVNRDKLPPPAKFITTWSTPPTFFFEVLCNSTLLISINFDNTLSLWPWQTLRRSGNWPWQKRSVAPNLDSTAGSALYHFHALTTSEGTWKQSIKMSWHLSPAEKSTKGSWNPSSNLVLKSLSFKRVWRVWSARIANLLLRRTRMGKDTFRVAALEGHGSKSPFKRQVVEENTLLSTKVNLQLLLLLVVSCKSPKVGPLPPQPTTISSSTTRITWFLNCIIPTSMLQQGMFMLLFLLVWLWCRNGFHMTRATDLGRCTSSPNRKPEKHLHGGFFASLESSVALPIHQRGLIYLVQHNERGVPLLSAVLTGGFLLSADRCSGHIPLQLFSSCVHSRPPTCMWHTSPM